MPLSRYVRLLCHSPQPGSNGYFRIGEIEMRTTPGGANLCTGGTAFGNSDNTPASRAFDGSIGNASNSWNGFPGDGRTVGYDFGSDVEINYIKVRNSDATWAPEYLQHLLTFDIQISTDGATWTTELAVSGHPGTTSAEVEYSIRRYTLQGTVSDAAGAPCARTVRAYRRDTGDQVGSAVSDAGTGAYSISSRHAGEHAIVFFPADGEALNALILDRITGV